MGLSVIRVSFSKQANDGDYGSETARCELEYTVSPDDAGAGGDLISDLLGDCRTHVHRELSKSPNWKVRRAVAEPELHAGEVPMFAGAEDDDE